MQSTGQGGRHSSQPVHQALSTVCMRFGPPAIAATGQASRHSAQPMQRDSSMRARRNGPSLPCAGTTRGKPRRCAVNADRRRRIFERLRADAAGYAVGCYHMSAVKVEREK